jgi:putative component of toxin-antitoxin plasmid stabilization module
MMYGSIAMGISREKFDEAFEKLKNAKTRARLKKHLMRRYLILR